MWLRLLFLKLQCQNIFFLVADGSQAFVCLLVFRCQSLDPLMIKVTITSSEFQHWSLTCGLQSPSRWSRPTSWWIFFFPACFFCSCSPSATQPVLRITMSSATGLGQINQVVCYSSVIHEPPGSRLLAHEQMIFFFYISNPTTKNGARSKFATNNIYYCYQVVIQ